MSCKILRGVKFCTCCGARILFQGYDTKQRLSHIMKKEMVCYDCAYWQDIIEYPPQYMEIIGNRCMKICPLADKKDKTLILGGRGKRRYFVRPDLTVFESNDIWLIGIIPERFREQLKPTAREITPITYKKLNRNHSRCKARGCFDRYHCLRYNLELETDGAFNSVPQNWKPGDEHCKFFIELDKAYIDDCSVTNKPNSQ